MENQKYTTLNRFWTAIMKMYAAQGKQAKQTVSMCFHTP